MAVRRGRRRVFAVSEVDLARFEGCCPSEIVAMNLSSVSNVGDVCGIGDGVVGDSGDVNVEFLLSECPPHFGKI